MRAFIQRAFILLLAAVFCGFSSGITICKMACLETGNIEYAINSESNCCEETQDDGCCENEESADINGLGCCTHSDNTYELDNYVPSHKIFVSPLTTEFSLITEFISNNAPISSLSLTLQNYHAPPLPLSEDFLSFTHTLRI